MFRWIRSINRTNSRPTWTRKIPQKGTKNPPTGNYYSRKKIPKCKWFFADSHRAKHCSLVSIETLFCVYMLLGNKQNQRATQSSLVSIECSAYPVTKKLLRVLPNSVRRNECFVYPKIEGSLGFHWRFTLASKALISLGNILYVYTTVAGSQGTSWQNGRAIWHSYNSRMPIGSKNIKFTSFGAEFGADFAFRNTDTS